MSEYLLVMGLVGDVWFLNNGLILAQGGDIWKGH